MLCGEEVKVELAMARTEGTPVVTDSSPESWGLWYVLCKAPCLAPRVLSWAATEAQEPQSL